MLSENNGQHEPGQLVQKNALELEAVSEYKSLKTVLVIMLKDSE